MSEDRQLTEQDVIDFVWSCNEMRREYYEKEFPNNQREYLDYKMNKKYVKIIQSSEDGTHKSVWAFLAYNGDILKPAGWNAPAKHARGNVFEAGHLKMTPYGPPYLR